MEAHMTRQEIIKALDAVGVTEGDIKELRKGSLQFYLNDSKGFEYRCAVQVLPKNCLAWEVFNGDEINGYDIGTFTSLDALIEGVDEIRG
jgi:hypothetical protein